MTSFPFISTYMYGVEGLTQIMNLDKVTHNCNHKIQTNNKLFMRIKFYNKYNFNKVTQLI